MVEAQQKESPKVFHDMTKIKGNLFSGKVMGIFIAVIVAGVFAGYLLSKTQGQLPIASTQSGSSAGNLKKGVIYGSTDTSTFKDTAEGIVQAGGINGEGQFHLVRPGGDTQNVYLTSSTVDLSQFTGHKVKVWGATQTAKYAGWLMDVGRVEVED